MISKRGSRVKNILSLIRTGLYFSRDPRIIRAQYFETQRQIPLLYALLIINAAVATYTYLPSAPGWLTLGGGSVLIAVCAWRFCAWTIFAIPASAISVERARAALRRTTVAAVPICAAFLCYALVLDQYSGPYESAGIAVCIGITVIACIFCLLYLPQAAILVQLTIIPPFLIYHCYHGNPILIAMAFNIAIVTGLMIRVLLNSFAGFTKLVLSQASLAAQQVEAERLNEDNARLALTDVLTGLPNRRLFFSRLAALLSECEKRGERFTVGVLDLDRFKPINDAYGHVVGDRVLVAVGARLATLSDVNTVVARLGGDEFGLLISGDIDRAGAIGQRVCDLLSQPFEIDDHHVSLGCSVGLAIFPEAGTTANDLFQHSDYALYSVKSTRRGGCAFFSADHETHIRSQLALEAALQTADLDKELHVEFQPIMCIETMAVLGVEALGRWTSPAIGEVTPDRFITAAERLGLMHPITIRLFRTALASFAMLPQGIGLSFNLSAHDVVSSHTIGLLVEAIGEAGVDPRRVTFELTETALMRDFDAAGVGINLLRGLGIAVALDDFGMGYSSLSYLNRLPLDKVKVDRSFISDMDEDSGSKIISAILGLCSTLELECIIEGVETEQQLRQVRDLGYRMAQGYLFARPMPLPALLTWLEQAGTARSGRQKPPIAHRSHPFLLAPHRLPVAKAAMR